MLSKVISASLHGIDGYLVTVEVDLSPGLPSLSIVGLPDTSIRESRDRVVAAIRNSGYRFPTKKITVNLAPAHIRKEGVSFDLPIAIGILCAAELIPSELIEDTCFIGELALDGTLRPVQGILPMTLETQNKKIRRLVLPQQNLPEASMVQEIELTGVSSLLDTIEKIKNPTIQKEGTSLFSLKIMEELKSDLDFSEIKGQSMCKRALEIAAGGAHNVLMVGPPGSGKTLLSKTIVSILPPLSWDQSIETTKIHSASGNLPPGTGLIRIPPFRNPHHTASNIALIGGGQNPKPGEVSLAHHGVLFLDELPEFRRDVLEVLRQPLESNEVLISRAKETLTFPTHFILIAAMNPCPCGFLGHPQRECVCTPHQIKRYRNKVSGPLLDRMDIQLEVPALTWNELEGTGHLGESSLEIRTRVNRVRQIQKDRFQGEKITKTNSQMNPKQIKKYCTLDLEAKSLLREAIKKFSLSGRAYDKILKISRTISDCENSEDIRPQHVAEAIQYRSLDRQN